LLISCWRLGQGSLHDDPCPPAHRDLLSGILGASNVSVLSVSGKETGGAASLTNPASHKACRSALNSTSRYFGSFLEAASPNFSPRLIEIIG
jgi:hypothetical protein